MYESFFGLACNPFQFSADPRFFYWSKGHQDLYRELKRSLDRANGFVVVTGEVGAGKTSLMQMLVGELNPRRTALVRIVSAQLDAENFLRTLELACHVPSPPAEPLAPRSARQRLAGLESHLARLGADGRHLLLLVDEAQNLTAGALNELFTLAILAREQRGVHFHCALVGQPELRERIEQAVTKRTGLPEIEFFNLGRLDESEIRAYVEHRLHQAGWSGDPRLHAASYLPLYAATDGIPRRINSLCNRLLLGAYLDKAHRITPGAVEATAAELRDELGEDALTGAADAPPRVTAPARGPAAISRSALSARLDRLERQAQVMLERVEALAHGRGARPRAVAPPPQAQAQRRDGWRRKERAAR